MDEKIPHYINDPVINKLTAPENKLYRPKINFVKAAIAVLITIGITLILSGIILAILNYTGFMKPERNSMITAFLSIYWIVQLIVLLFTLRYILIWFIRVYQRYAKSETRLRCCFTPSCSEYAILALKKYGLVVGIYKAVNRLLRCGPPGGIDYP